MKITTTNFTDNLKVEKSSYNFVSLKKAEKKLNFILEKLPFSYKILLENLIINIDKRIFIVNVMILFFFKKIIKNFFIQFAFIFYKIFIEGYYS